MNSVFAMAVRNKCRIVVDSGRSTYPSVLPEEVIRPKLILFFLECMGMNVDTNG